MNKQKRSGFKTNFRLEDDIPLFEEFLNGKRKPLREGTLEYAVYTSVIYTADTKGYTVKEMAKSFNVAESAIRSTICDLFFKHYPIGCVVEEVRGGGRGRKAGVLRTMSHSELAANTVFLSRYKRFEPALRAITVGAEMVAIELPSMLPKVKELTEEMTKDFLEYKRNIKKLK